MRTFVILALACFACLASAQVFPTKTLVGSWSVNDTCNNFCCCPNGVLTINADTTNVSQVIAQSTAWDSNSICQQLNLTSTSSSIALPFPSTATLDDLQSYINQQIEGDFGIIYILTSITKKGVVTPTYTVALEVDQASQGGEICTFTMTSNPHFIFN